MGAVADGCVMSCLPQGGYRGPNPAGPLVFFPLFLSRQKGCACAARAQNDFIFKKRKTDCHAPFGARKDRTVVNRTFYGGCNDRIVSIVLICKLRIIKLCIKAVLFKQLLVRALLSYPAAVHNKYAVGVAYG